MCSKVDLLIHNLSRMPMFLFFIGLIEMVIATVWTRMVSRGEMFASGFVTFVNILIWYYVLQQVVDDITNWRLIVLYAAGCAFGTVLGMRYFHRKDGEEKVSSVTTATPSTSVDASHI